MPKFLENYHGSEMVMSKICKIFFPVSLATVFDRSGDFVSPMKRSVRPLFSVLLLIVFAVTISCRTVVRRGFGHNVFVQTPVVPVFNSALMKWAAIDVGEEKSKQQIEQLLEGNFSSIGRFRTFVYWRRFNRGDIRVRPSMGLPAILRSPKFYRVWLGFQRVLGDWARGKKFQPEIMSKLIELVKNPIDRHNGVVVSSNRRYSTCAIVGNSGILLKSDYGKLIDSHEVVIRLNNARIEKFESNVGTKTNISFVNSNILYLCGRRQGCFCHPYGENVPIIMYICQPIHFLDYTVCNSSHKAPLLVTDPRFDVLCARIVKYYSLKRFMEGTGKSLEEWGSTHEGSMFHYSSGMQAVMLALGICDKVSLFGFGKSDLAKHHYHTNQKAELPLHDYEAEYEIYRDLAERPQVIPFISDKFKIPPVVIHH